MNQENIDNIEKSCYWAHFGHQRNYCPTCVNLPPCPHCGSKDYMKNVSAMGMPDKWIKCFGCGHQTCQYNTFSQAMVAFWNKPLAEIVEHENGKDTVQVQEVWTTTEKGSLSQ